MSEEEKKEDKDQEETTFEDLHRGKKLERDQTYLTNDFYEQVEEAFLTMRKIHGPGMGVAVYISDDGVFWPYWTGGNHQRRLMASGVLDIVKRFLLDQAAHACHKALAADEAQSGDAEDPADA